MTPDLERFLDLATRPLESAPGDREEAKGELMARVCHRGVPLEMLDLNGPSERLGSAPPRKPLARRVVMLLAMLILIGAVAMVATRQVREFVLMQLASQLTFRVQYGVPYDDEGIQMIDRHVRQVAPGIPLGVMDFAPKSGDGLFHRHPDDLAMLQEHVARRMISNRNAWTGFTDEESEAIARLDPDNALWPLMQVVPYLAQATGSGSRMAGRYYSPGSTVTSEPDFQQALRHLSEAAAKPVYRDHSMGLRRRQMEAFPHSRSIAEDLIVKSFAELVTPPFRTYGSDLSSLARIHCERLEKAADPEGLRTFLDEWKRLTRLLAESDPAPPGMSGELEGMGMAISSASSSLGNAVIAADALRWIKAITDSQASMSSATPELEEAAGARLGYSPVPRDLTVEELHPPRLAEMSYKDRTVAAVFSVLALLFAGFTGFEACRRSRPVKGMARGLMPLFRWQDHLWIGALGLAVPWLWWWGMTRLTPLGLRDLNFNNEWNVVSTLLQSAAGLVFGMVMLLQTTRWRWGKRGGFLGLGKSFGWAGWLVAGLAGLAIPLAGAIRYLSLTDDQSAYFLLGVAGMAACGLLWLLWEVVINLFTPRSSALRPNVTMRAMLPWAMAGVLTLLAGHFGAVAAERYWFSRDTLLPTWTSRTHLNALEERIADDFRAAIRDL